MYKYETALLAEGKKIIAGCDEVGRGPLAGPVVCAAVVLDYRHKIEGLNDSKQLTKTKREQLAKQIKKKALAYSIVYIWPEEIDRINIYQASKKGMMEAVKNLNIEVEHVLTDAMPLESLGIPYTAIIKGDTISANIAAASIIAKVDRDKYMDEMDEKYPGYGFKNNKGYPTKEHLEAIKKLGVVEIHRKTYGPVSEAINEQLTLDFGD